MYVCMVVVVVVVVGGGGVVGEGKGYKRKCSFT